MTIFLEGLAFPLGEKNVNGWGIPESEAENAISTLKASVLKICPGEAHACDYSEDPYGRIGRIVDAWRQGNGIYVKASVTDSVASRKIKEGTWDEHTWSVYADSNVDPKLNSGWAKGFTAKALTLVKKPAWTQAQYNVSAASDGKVKLHTFSQFQITASQEGDPITPDLEKRIGELETQLAEKDKLISELQPKADTLETQVSELTASKTTLEKELGEKTALVASLELEKAGSVPMKTVEEKIVAAIEKHDAEMEVKRTLAAAREKFVAARKELGLETKQDEFTSLSASDFEAMTETLSVKLSASANQPPRYSANNPTSGSKIQVYDPTTNSYIEKVV